VNSTVSTFNTNILTYITVINLFNSASNSTITFIYEYKQRSGKLSRYCGGLRFRQLRFNSWQGQDFSLLYWVQIEPGFHSNPQSYGYS
jgi:hypothetical protein